MLRLKPKRFKWKKTKKEDIGLIAEEVNKVYPELIVYNEDKEIEGLKYGSLTPILFDVTKRHQEKIEDISNNFYICLFTVKITEKGKEIEIKSQDSSNIPREKSVILVQPLDQYSKGYGRMENGKFIISGEKEGRYNVLVLSTDQTRK